MTTNAPHRISERIQETQALLCSLLADGLCTTTDPARLCELRQRARRASVLAAELADLALLAEGLDRRAGHRATDGEEVAAR